jgi:hypothetical protein
VSVDVVPFELSVEVVFPPAAYWISKANDVIGELRTTEEQIALVYLWPTVMSFEVHLPIQHS